MPKQYDILIIGGGLAGLCNAIHLSRSGLSVCLIEKNEFPKHKVCGEYISNEVLPYLQWLGVDPFDHGATDISKFELSTNSGKKISTELPLGGFGISRYTLDYALLEKAIASGCQIIRDTVDDIKFEGEHFLIQTKSSQNFQATHVIGAFGKRSKLDKSLHRKFINEQAPYLGVKAHYTGEFPKDLVALHNFKGGYCGVSKVENDFINICYLVNFESFKKYKNIEAFQHEVLMKNPNLKDILTNCTIAFEQPITISQISFLPKKTVDSHILMSGDAAGMIHPLCGNGMGMAIHSALILSELLLQFFDGNIKDRLELEKRYQSQWDQIFWKRLKAGRLFNQLFTRQNIFETGLKALSYFPSLLPTLIQQTHGEPIRIPSLKVVGA